MCRTDHPPKTLFLRSEPNGNLGGGHHEFRDIDITHWENSPLWALRCIGWHMLNEAGPVPVRNDPSLSLHIDGFTTAANSTACPLAIALPDHNGTFVSVESGPEVVGSLDGRLLRFSVRLSRTGVPVPTDTWIAILECRPVSSD